MDRFAAPAPATLDGNPITGAPVATKAFNVHVNRGADTPGQPLYSDSVDLGHPGRLASTFCGFKAEVNVTPGPHTIIVDLTGVVGHPLTFTYKLLVK